MISSVFVSRFEWRGITIEVSYEPNWLNLSEAFGEPVAHVQVRSVTPERTPLPFTETGYRSAYPRTAAVMDEGGSVGFVLRWLDETARSPEWVAREESARQLALF